MGLYAYNALDTGGREVAGVIEADDPPAAAAALRRRLLFVVDLVPADGGEPAGAAGAPAVAAGAERGGTGTGGAAASTRRTAPGLQGGLLSLLPVRTRDVVFFFRQLALMLRTGLTLLSALEVAREQCTKRRLERAVEDIAASVRGGQPFSRALARRPDLFPDVATRLVETAEASGELDLILDRIASQMERRLELRTSLVTSLIYPTVVVALSVGVVAFLVTKVIPKFAAYFERRAVPLPPATRMLLDVASFLGAHGPKILVAGAAAAGLVLAVRATAAGRQAVDRGVLFVPVVGALLRTAAMAQLARTLAVLLKSGLTLLDSLRIVGRTVSNAALTAHVERAAEDVLRGRDLASSIREPALIPPLVAQVVAVGERSGTLDQVLEEVGEHYDRELQVRIKRMSALFEPLVVLVVGGLVGFVYFAFFQAVFQLAGGR